MDYFTEAEGELLAGRPMVKKGSGGRGMGLKGEITEGRGGGTVGGRDGEGGCDSGRTTNQIGLCLTP